jgi:hypothetical protein
VNGRDEGGQSEINQGKLLADAMQRIYSEGYTGVLLDTLFDDWSQVRSFEISLYKIIYGISSVFV